MGSAFDNPVQQLPDSTDRSAESGGPSRSSAGGSPVRSDRATRRGSGLPSGLKAAIEHLSGESMDGVRVRYRSSEPARVDALALARGPQIDVAPGQEHHLPHESWHVVQQMQGRVRPMRRIDGTPRNNEQHLEREADLMGARADRLSRSMTSAVRPTRIRRSPAPDVVQRERGLGIGDPVTVRVTSDDEVLDLGAKIISVSPDGARYDVSYDEVAYNGVLPVTHDEAKVKMLRGKRVVAVDKAELSVAPWESADLGLEPKEKVELKRIGEGAGRIGGLSEEQLEEMIEYLRLRAATPALSELIKQLVTDLADLQKRNEPAEQIHARELLLEKEITAAENDAFKAQFEVDVEAATWNTLWPKVNGWLEALKRAEAAEGTQLDAFHAAYLDHRMTARQINVASTARGGRFPVKRSDRRSEETPRTMNLDNTVAGISKRMKPENFKDRRTVNEQGVHDLSASLLDGSKPNIFKQLKSYEESVVLFMPLPAEKDLRVLSALARVSNVDPQQLNLLQSLITHPKFAQASDMGTTYVDTDNGPGPDGSFEYGVKGTVIRESGDRARKINTADLAARRKGALFYRQIATAAITTVNEIVMAYRHHESGIFPMYARWEGTKQGVGRFVVVGPPPGLKPTGLVITSDGHLGGW